MKKYFVLVVLTLSAGSTGAINCEEHGQCLQSDVIGITYPKDAYSCLRDCKGQEGCLFYTFKPELGNLCELLANCETFDTAGCSSCTSGSVSCPDVICSVPGLCQVSLDSLCSAQKFFVETFVI